MPFLFYNRFHPYVINSLSQTNLFYNTRSLIKSRTYRVKGGHLRKERVWKIPSFCRGFRGSLTIEASLGLTLFLLFMTSLCQLFLVMQLQLRIQRALEQINNEAAQYCYLSSQVALWDSDSRLLSEIEDYLLAEVSEEALRMRFISVIGEEALAHSVLEGGSGSLSFDGSSILLDEHRIRLTVSYRIRLPVAALGINSFTVRQQSYRYGWLGDADPMKKVENDEQMVYVTKTGQVYHLTLSCTYLNLSVRSVSMSQVEDLRNDSGAKYYACERCRPKRKGKYRLYHRRRHTLSRRPGVQQSQEECDSNPDQ